MPVTRLDKLAGAVLSKLLEQAPDQAQAWAQRIDPTLRDYRDTMELAQYYTRLGNEALARLDVICDRMQALIDEARMLVKDGGLR